MDSIRTCSVEECDREYLAKGYCRPHYQRMRLYGDTFLGSRPGNMCSFPGCVNKAGSMDICKPHRLHRKAGHELRPLKKDMRGMPLDVRLDANIAKGDGCWMWVGARIKAGYGVLALNGKTTRAHRLMFERANGPIPTGMVVDHMCHNPACVRPDHLQLATDKQNNEKPGRS